MLIDTRYEVDNFLKVVDLNILHELLTKHYNGALISKPMLVTFSDGLCGIVYISCFPNYPYAYSVNVLSPLDMYTDQYYTEAEHPAQLARPSIMFEPTYFITKDDKEKLIKYAHTLAKKPSNVDEKTLNSYREMLLNINKTNQVKGKTYAQTWADRIHRDVERKYNATIEQAKRERSLGINELDKFKTSHNIPDYYSDPTDTLTHTN